MIAQCETYGEELNHSYLTGSDGTLPFVRFFESGISQEAGRLTHVAANFIGALEQKVTRLQEKK